jgi:uncharacterized protein (TIGR02246 family)
MISDEITAFAESYTAAWCSQNPDQVAAHFEADGGTLTINEGEPSIGRSAIAAAAREFMTAFPDLTVEMDGLGQDGDRIVYRWTLKGTHTGEPDPTGNSVRVSGTERWRMGPSGLIADSIGSFDAEEYARQLVQS